MYPDLPAYVRGVLVESLPKKFKADMLSHVSDHGPHMEWQNPDLSAWCARLSKVQQGHIQWVFSKTTYLDVFIMGPMWVTRLNTRSSDIRKLHWNEPLLKKSAVLSSEQFSLLLAHTWGYGDAKGSSVHKPSTRKCANDVSWSQRQVMNYSWERLGLSGARAFMRDQEREERMNKQKVLSERVVNKEHELHNLNAWSRQSFVGLRDRTEAWPDQPPARLSDTFVKPYEFRRKLHMMKAILDFADRAIKTSSLWPHLLARMPIPRRIYHGRHSFPLPFTKAEVHKDNEGASCLYWLFNYSLVGAPGQETAAWVDEVRCWGNMRHNVYTTFKTTLSPADHVEAEVGWHKLADLTLPSSVDSALVLPGITLSDNVPPVRKPTHKVSRTSQGLSVSSGGRIPFTEEEFKAWWKGEKKISTPYGEPSRIQASTPEDRPFWLVKVGCHEVDVAGDLGGDYIELMRPDFEVVKGQAVPEAVETVREALEGRYNQELRVRLLKALAAARAYYEHARRLWLAYVRSIRKEVFAFERDRPAAQQKAADELAALMTESKQQADDLKEWWVCVGGVDLRQIEGLMCEIMTASIPEHAHVEPESTGTEEVMTCGEKNTTA